MRKTNRPKVPALHYQSIYYSPHPKPKKAPAKKSQEQALREKLKEAERAREEAERRAEEAERALLVERERREQAELWVDQRARGDGPVPANGG